MSPEIILSSGHGKGVDWWALGILCYEMQVGQPPWIDSDGNRGPMGIYQQILSGKPAKYPKFMDPDAKGLIKLLLEPDLTRRFGCLKVEIAPPSLSLFFFFLSHHHLFLLLIAFTELFS